MRAWEARVSCPPINDTARFADWRLRAYLTVKREMTRQLYDPQYGAEYTVFVRSPVPMTDAVASVIGQIVRDALDCDARLVVRVTVCPAMDMVVIRVKEI